jgi:RNase P/RNase MRP subunit p30
MIEKDDVLYIENRDGKVLHAATLTKLIDILTSPDHPGSFIINDFK